MKESIKSVARYPHGGNCTLREAKFREVDVSKLVMSVSEMVDGGSNVISGRVGGTGVNRVAHEESGVPMEFVRSNRLACAVRDRRQRGG